MQMAIMYPVSGGFYTLVDRFVDVRARFPNLTLKRLFLWTTQLIVYAAFLRIWNSLRGLLPWDGTTSCNGRWSIL